MNIFATVLLSAAILPGCGSGRFGQDKQTKASPVRNDIVGNWTLCSTDYKLSEPDAYFQVMRFSTEGKHSMTRKSFKGLDCGSQIQELETLEWTYAYRLGPTTGNGTEIFMALEEAKLRLASDDAVEDANRQKLWGYGDWQLGVPKDLKNRREQDNSPVDFQTGIEHLGGFRIDGGKLHINPGIEKSDEAFWKVVGFTRGDWVH